MHKLNSSARIKRRYLIIEGTKENVELAILEYIGILGWANAKPYLLPQKEGKIILAIDRVMLNEMRAAFELCREKIKVLRVSGTIKGLKKK